MREDRKIRPEDIEQASVHLKPILGVHARVWVPSLYAAVIVAALFCLLVLPGILKPGSIVEFRGAPAAAGVYESGAYRGSTSEGFFLKAGSHSLEISRPGFSVSAVDTKVPSRLFGSLFFPRRHAVAYRLRATDPVASVASAYSEFSVWSLSGKPTAIYQIPPVLSDSFMALAETGTLPGTEASGNSSARTAGLSVSLAARALAMSSSAAAARDATRTAFIQSASGAPSPVGAIAGLRTLFAAAGTGPQGIAWLKDLLAADGNRGKAETALASVSPDLPRRSPLASPVGSSQSVGGIEFVRFHAASFVMAGQSPEGGSIPYAADVPAFALARTEVTRAQWSAFTAANPEWSTEGKKALVDAGFADDSYLAEGNGARTDMPSGSGNLPMTGISWDAAAAYCGWLSAFAGPGYRVTLPTEAMYEYAAGRAGLEPPGASAKGVWADASRQGPARVASLPRDGAGLNDLLGNVWEWCADSYLPYPSLSASGPDAAERSVRGGSWANLSNAVTIFSRGGVDHRHSSAYLGFRPALVAK